MTYREKLREIAAGRNGYITTADAAEVGVPGVELRKMATRGALGHVARGVYRFPEFSWAPQDAPAAAVLRVGPDAALANESVLALHGLAFVDPREVTVVTPRRVRLAEPRGISVIQRDVPTDELTYYGGILSVKVWRALIDCKGRVMTERLLDAVGDARRRDLVTPAEAARVRRALRGNTRKGRL